MGTAQLAKRKEATGRQEYPEPIDNQRVIRTLQQALQDLEKIDEQLKNCDNVQDYVFPKETHLAIREIQDLKRKEQRIFEILQIAGVASLPFNTPLSLLFTLLGWRQGVRYDKLRRLVQLMKELDAAFREQGIEMQALIEHPSNEPIDLLIRFPGKHFFLLCIRSYGDAEVFFDEKKQKFFQKRANNKGRRAILLDPIDTSMQQIIWLQKHYRPFFGGTSRAAKRPLTRILVVWPPSRLGKHRDELYETFGEAKVLAARYERGGAIFAVNREDVVKFIEEYLAFRINKERTDNDVER